jgi:DNA-binding transcriptional ArsR family regulator
MTNERATDTVRVRRRTATRLSVSQVTALVDSYRAGETVYELAARFGIHRATVSAHLHRQGITLRRQGLNAQGVAHAVRLYEDGWSVTRIGHRL